MNCAYYIKARYFWSSLEKWGFPASSTGKESTCNAGDLGSIPGSERAPGEGIGYPLQYSWISLVALLVKNLPAMWETWVQSLGWEDPLEKGTASHSSILAWRIPWGLYSPWGHKESDTAKWVSLSLLEKWDERPSGINRLHVLCHHWLLGSGNWRSLSRVLRLHVVAGGKSTMIDEWLI